MARAPADTPSRVSVPAGTLLEEAARRLTESGEQMLHVLDESGQVCGRVDMQRIVAAMVTPSEHH